MASEMADTEADEYWGEFIPAMLGTRLGNCQDSSPELAAAWLGWQVARRYYGLATSGAVE